MSKFSLKMVVVVILMFVFSSVIAQDVDEKALEDTINRALEKMTSDLPSIAKIAVPEPTEPSKGTEKPQQVSKGDIIPFGRYSWRVLDVVENRALIITEEIVEERRFDSSSNNWAGSEIRRYLNNEFYNSFSADEKARIGGANDKVFLLTKSEAVQYFSGDSDRELGAFWWLRSPNSGINASTVSSNGSIKDKDILVFSYGGVRPALWLKL
jgi:hypothetical protein